MFLSCCQVHAEQQLQETLAQKQAEASKLKDQMQDLKSQNQRLHGELERAAGQSATAAADAAGMQLNSIYSCHTHDIEQVSVCRCHALWSIQPRHCHTRPALGMNGCTTLLLLPDILYLFSRSPCSNAERHIFLGPSVQARTPC